eukprot:CAMPEP_0198303352 /NCGR_PEP_ID=MMETSP1449-20131203/56841_1 /TAXON_ID=420275 /ORGANISM="Attheya septentrionalis, Strain CCMP2084" /LENGTH=596 /DNA_ID=CAMNT_0044005839 /DNA_START=41 /DNA_END=1831 /DNA_ORIENTATION=-
MVWSSVISRHSAASRLLAPAFRQTGRTVTSTVGVLPNQSAVGWRSFAASSGSPSSLASLADSSQFHSSESFQSKWSPQLTKIVGTIGPTSEQLPVLQKLVHSGLRVMRLNFSHATVEEVELRVKNLRLCQGRHGAFMPQQEDAGAPVDQNVRAILLDTRGPEIRSGKLQGDHSGHETLQLQEGETITLRTEQRFADEGSTATDLYINYPSLHKSVVPGMKVLLDDGAIVLTAQTVESEKEFHGSVVCTIDNSGDLRSRAGVNLPGAETDLPAMSDKDKVDIKYGMTKDVDFIAASFIQNAAGVHEIRRYVKECATDLGWDPKAPLPLIISKIESVSGLSHFDDILEASDGIMVARGDLGVEMPIQQVANAQKEMVAACNAVGKPVIVATQMLESMAKNPRPTRAEVADVTNAVYDGADAVMLSGETAKGKYPVEAVRMMNEIILSAERFAKARPDLVGGQSPGSKVFTENSKKHARCVSAGIAKAAVTVATERDARAIIVSRQNDDLPRLVSAYRPSCPIITFCESAKVARQLILHKGVHPVVDQGGLSHDKRAAAAIQRAVKMGFIHSGEDVIVLSKEDDGIPSFYTMKVATVQP